MKKLFFLFLFGSYISYSQQFPSDFWHEGLLVNSEGDTLKGSLKYDFESQSIQLDDGQVIKAINVNNLFYFEIYDESIKDFRQFYSLMYQVGYSYNIPVLFEMMIEGKLSLMLREKIVAESTNSFFPSYYAYGLMPSFSNNYGYVNRVKYDYFFLTEDGNILKFSGKKKDLYNVMNDKEDEIKKYMSDNRLNLKKMKDLARVVSYYNRI